MGIINTDHIFNFGVILSTGEVFKIVLPDYVMIIPSNPFVGIFIIK